MTFLARLPSLVAGLALLAPGALPAQDSTAAATPRPPALVLDSAAGRRLAEGEWRYVATVTRRDATVELGRRTLAVRAGEEAGRPAWLLVDETESHGQVLRDTLAVGRDDLRPLRRHADIGPMTMELDFRGDSIVGELRVPGAPAAPIALGSEPGLVVSSAMLESALTLAPLAPGWSVTVHQLAVSPVGTSLLPLTLTVTGEETVTVPAGTFESWVVEVAAAEVAQRLWVEKGTGRVVRARNPVPQTPDVVYETVLVEAHPAAG